MNELETNVQFTKNLLANHICENCVFQNSSYCTTDPEDLKLDSNLMKNTCFSWKEPNK